MNTAEKVLEKLKQYPRDNNIAIGSILSAYERLLEQEEPEEDTGHWDEPEEGRKVVTKGGPGLGGFPCECGGHLVMNTSVGVLPTTGKFHRYRACRKCGKRETAQLDMFAVNAEMAGSSLRDSADGFVETQKKERS